MISDVTLSHELVASELRPVLLRLARELRKETEQLGVTARQATLLWLVKRSPGLSLAELAAEEGISPPALSGHVDRLERAGLLERVRSNEDRRRVGLRLTEEGARLMRRVRARRTTWLAERLRKLDQSELAAIERGRPGVAPSRRRRRVTTLALALRTRTFRSLGVHRNYRIFFVGQLVSLAGSWMQNVALAWLVLELSGSPLAVGALVFCRFLPFTIFGLAAGIVADRIDSRRLVMGTQGAALLVSVALAVVTLTGTATLPLVYILAALGGITLAFDAPGRQSLTYQMVGPRELPNADRAERRPLQRLARDRPGDRGRRHRGFRHGDLLRDQRVQLPRRARRPGEPAPGGAALRRARPIRADHRGHAAGVRFRPSRPPASRRAHRRHDREHRRFQLPRARAAPRIGHARRGARGIRPALGGLRSRRPGRGARHRIVSQSELAAVRHRSDRLRCPRTRAGARWRTSR